jgi:hypothetical protein
MRFGINVILLLLAAFVPLAGSLASASMVDPTWIGGLWDGDDGDEAVLAAAELEGVPVPGRSALEAHRLPVLGPLQPAEPGPVESASGPRPSIRAPPAA